MLIEDQKEITQQLPSTFPQFLFPQLVELQNFHHLWQYIDDTTIIGKNIFTTSVDGYVITSSLIEPERDGFHIIILVHLSYFIVAIRLH
jgi:hypothetical protein